MKCAHKTRHNASCDRPAADRHTTRRWSLGLLLLYSVYCSILQCICYCAPCTVFIATRKFACRSIQVYDPQLYLVGATIYGRSTVVGEARIFSAGCTLVDQKSHDFLVITLCYMVIIYVIYWYTAATNYLCISSAGVHLAKFSPIFASIQQKMPTNFFRRPGEVHLYPLHPLATPM